MKKTTAIVFIPSSGMVGSSLSLSHFIDRMINKNINVYAVIKVPGIGSKFLESRGVKIIGLKYPISLSISGADEYSHNVVIIKNIFKFIYGVYLSIKIFRKHNNPLIILGDITFLQVTLFAKYLHLDILTFVRTSPSKRLFKKLLINHIIPFSKAVIGITPIHLQEIRMKNIDKFVIHNIIDRETNDDFNKLSNIYSKMNVGSKFCIIFLGGISKIKGSYEFVKLANLICSFRNDVSFMLIGNYHKDFSTNISRGTANSELNLNQIIFNYIKDNGLEKKVHLIGEIDNVEYFIRNSDILISMNNYPHFSRPIVEAWKCKKAVVANDDIFNRYLIQNHKNGILIAKYDMQTFVLQCNLLMDNEMLRKKIGNEGYKTYEKLFNQKKIINQIDYALDKMGL